MRTAAPFQVNRRQLRALVLLLALLPLMPAAFVLRFLIEEIRTERLEARAHAKDVYQTFLSATSTSLAAYARRQIPVLPAVGAADPWQVFRSTEMADTLFLVGSHGKLTAPPPPATHVAEGRENAAEKLAQTLLETGLNHISLANATRLRWRFFSETPQPLFAVAVPPPLDNIASPEILLVVTRHHLLEEIGAYYEKLLDRKSVLRVIDENGESAPLLARDTTAEPAGEELAQMALPPPLPTWRVELFSADATMIDGTTNAQVSTYAACWC